jgi:hypothetical protein
MKKYILGLTFGCAICLESTLAFAETPVPTPPIIYNNVSGASISGAVMYQAPDGAVTTVTGQITLPQNYYYEGNATVGYTSEGTPGENDFRPTSITLGPEGGSDAIKAVDASASATAVTAKELQDAFEADDLPKAISIIRAAGGANGLE